MRILRDQLPLLQFHSRSRKLEVAPRSSRHPRRSRGARLLSQRRSRLTISGHYGRRCSEGSLPCYRDLPSKGRLLHASEKQAAETSMKIEWATSGGIKLARAQRHIDELNTLIGTFHKTNPYRVVREKDGDTG